MAPKGPFNNNVVQVLYIQATTLWQIVRFLRVIFCYRNWKVCWTHFTAKLENYVTHNDFPHKESYLKRRKNVKLWKVQLAWPSLPDKMEVENDERKIGSRTKVLQPRRFYIYYNLSIYVSFQTTSSPYMSSLC